MRRGVPLAALFASALASGCASSPAPRVLVIGLDGADWDILDPLVAAGRMPHLARLQESGVRAPLRTLERLPLSPVIWTSIATGRGPEAHGITWFLVDTPDGRRVPVRSTDRRVPALWNMLAGSDRRVGVVGWWATAPAEPVGRGVVASDALGFHGFGRGNSTLPESRKVAPPERAAELALLVPPPRQIDWTFASRFFHMTADDWQAGVAAPAPDTALKLFQQAASTTLGYTAIARRLLEEGTARTPFDLFLVYYESTDSLAHLFMKDAPPRLPWVSDADFERNRDVVDEWYEFMDGQIGALVAAAPRGTSIVLVSDHGFRTGADRPRSEATVDVRGAHLDHDPDGIFLASGPLFRADGARVAVASVLDVAPTLLHALGLPVGRDMEGRVLSEVFEPGFTAARPIAYVATWGEPASEAVAEAAAAPEEFDEAAATRQLRALGYVGPEEDAAANPPAGSREQHVNLGRLLARRGEFDAAIREFRAAMDGTPRDAEALTEIGNVELARGERERARRCFVEALQLDPANRRALMRLAGLRILRGELSDAEAMVRQVLAQDDRLPEAWVSLGDVLERQGRHDEAASVLEHALELDPRDVAARYNLGVVRMAQGRWDDARTCYERVLELAPDHPFARNNLGTVHLRCGEIDEAIACYRRVAESNPGHVESRVNLGSLLLAREKAAEAVPWLEQAVEIDPGLEPAQLLLAKASAATGEVAGARRRLEALVRLFPGSPAACVELARLALREEEVERAREWLRHAVRRGGAGLRAELAADPEFAAIGVEELDRN